MMIRATSSTLSVVQQEERVVTMMLSINTGRDDAASKSGATAANVRLVNVPPPPAATADEEAAPPSHRCSVFPCSGALPLPSAPLVDSPLLRDLIAYLQPPLGLRNDPEKLLTVLLEEEGATKFDLVGTRLMLGIQVKATRTDEDIVKVMQYHNALAAQLLEMRVPDYVNRRAGLPSASATPSVFASVRGCWMATKERPAMFDDLDGMRRVIRLAWNGLKVNGTADPHYVQMKATMRWTPHAVGREEAKRSKRQRVVA